METLLQQTNRYFINNLLFNLLISMLQYPFVKLNLNLHKEIYISILIFNLRLVFQLQNDMSSLGRTPAGEMLISIYFIHLSILTFTWCITLVIIYIIYI